MDIYQDIERATHIPYVDDNATFYRRKQPRNRPLPVRTRNAHLLEEYPDHYSERECMLDLPKTINPIEIATSIRMAPGAISCSNEEVDEFWRSRQTSSSKEERAKIAQDNAAFDFVKKGDSYNISTSNIGNSEFSQTRNCELINEDEDVEQEETVLKSCKLDRNAAIKGLIKSNMISLKDLTVPDEKKCIDPKDVASGYSNTEIGQANPLSENAKGLTYVSSPHDPDILITPLQAYGIDESKYKDIDFRVPRLGTKMAVTPLEYLIYGIDEDSFNFVQKK